MSQYTPEERTAILAAAREALAVKPASERSDLAAAEDPRWPIRGPLIPVRSTAAMDLYRKQAEATEQMLEQGRQERRQEEQRLIRERQAATFRTELDARTDAIVEAVAGFTVESIAKVRSELRDEMLAALAGLKVELSTRSDKAAEVIDLPALLPPHRRSSDAA
jgi:hypothetical protein